MSGNKNPHRSGGPIKTFDQGLKINFKRNLHSFSLHYSETLNRQLTNAKEECCSFFSIGVHWKRKKNTLDSKKKKKFLPLDEENSIG